MTLPNIAPVFDTMITMTINHNNADDYDDDDDNNNDYDDISL